MKRLVVGFSLALSGWVCGGIYLILAARALSDAVKQGNWAFVGEAAFTLGLGVVSWAVLLYLASLLGIRRPRIMRKRSR